MNRGPIEQLSKFTSCKLKLDSFKRASTNGINFCECVFSSLLCFSIIKFLSSKRQTLQTLEEVSIASIFNVKLTSFHLI